MLILVVSDVHANFTALEAVIQDAGSFDQIWCLGDLVGYGPEPNECIERLRAFDLVCLAGNHDLAVVGKLGLWDFSDDAKNVVAWTRHQLTPVNREWLETLSPVSVLVKFDVTLAHASPRDPIWEYISTPPIARVCFEHIATSFCFHGHTHAPIIYRKSELFIGIATEFPTVNVPLSLNGDRLLINPGSVGQPRDDDPRAAYAIFDSDARTLIWRRVQYDVSATQKKMKQAKLPGGLSRRLRFGQ